MKLHLIKPFVLWILKKIVSTFAEANREYRKTLSREPGLATFIWFFVSIGVALVISIISAIASQGSETVIGWSAIISFTVSTGYLLYQSFSLMFAAFTKDRQELFNNLKE